MTSLLGQLPHLVDGAFWSKKMPILKPRVKQETRLPKIGRLSGRLKETELTGRGRPEHIADASLVCIPCVSQCRRDVFMSFGSAYSE